MRPHREGAKAVVPRWLLCVMAAASDVGALGLLSDEVFIVPYWGAFS